MGKDMGLGLTVKMSVVYALPSARPSAHVAVYMPRDEEGHIPPALWATSYTVGGEEVGKLWGEKVHSSLTRFRSWNIESATWRDLKLEVEAVRDDLFARARSSARVYRALLETQPEDEEWDCTV